MSYLISIYPRYTFLKNPLQTQAQSHFQEMLLTDKRAFIYISLYKLHISVPITTGNRKSKKSSQNLDVEPFPKDLSNLQSEHLFTLLLIFMILYYGDLYNNATVNFIYLVHIYMKNPQHKNPCKLGVEPLPRDGNPSKSKHLFIFTSINFIFYQAIPQQKNALPYYQGYLPF